MYYDRYLDDTCKCHNEMMDLAVRGEFSKMAAYIMASAATTTKVESVSPAMNFLFYTAVLQLAETAPCEGLDEHGILSYYKCLSSQTIGVTCGAFQQMMTKLRIEGHEAFMNSVAQSVRYAYHIISWAKSGKQRYRLSEGLAQELHDTKFSELSCEDVRLPYPALYIEVPKRLGFQVYNRITGLHPLEGVFLSEDSVVLKQKGSNFIPRSGMIDPSTIELSSGRVLHTLLIGSSKNPQNPMDDATCTTTMDMTDGARKLELEVEETAKVADLEENCSRYPATMAWITNVLLYATWPDAILEKGWADPRAEKLWKAAQQATNRHQAKKLQRKIEQHHATDRITLLGGNIVVDRTAPLYQAGAGEGTGKRLSIRIRVPGFWKKHQPYGPKRSLRRLAWVRGHYRGPDDAPVKFSGHELVAKHLTKEVNDGQPSTDLPTAESPHTTVETKDGGA